MGEGKIRGIHLINVIAYIKTKKGVQGIQELLGQVNDRLGEPKYSFDVIYEGSWYPFDDYLEFMRVAEKITGTGDNKVCREIGRRLVKNLGTFSHLISTESIEKWLNTARVRFHYIYSTGEFEIKELAKNKAVVVYKGFPAIPEVSNYFQGSLEGGMKALELDGKVIQSATPKSPDDPLEFTLTWK